MFDASGLLEQLSGSEPETDPRPASPAVEANDDPAIERKGGEPPREIGAGRAPARQSGKPVESGTGARPAAGDSHADREWDRFLGVCVPMAGGGWRDPDEPILRPGDRKSVVEGKSVELGGRRNI